MERTGEVVASAAVDDTMTMESGHVHRATQAASVVLVAIGTRSIESFETLLLPVPSHERVRGSLVVLDERPPALELTTAAQRLRVVVGAMACVSLATTTTGAPADMKIMVEGEAEEGAQVPTILVMQWEDHEETSSASGNREMRMEDEEVASAVARRAAMQDRHLRATRDRDTIDRIMGGLISPRKGLSPVTTCV